MRAVCVSGERRRLALKEHHGAYRRGLRGANALRVQRARSTLPLFSLEAFPDVVPDHSLGAVSVEALGRTNAQDETASRTRVPNLEPPVEQRSPHRGLVDRGR